MSLPYMITFRTTEILLGDLFYFYLLLISGTVSKYLLFF